MSLVSDLGARFTPSREQSDTHRLYLGVVFKLMAILLFVGMGTLAKIATETIPLGQVLFARNALALIPVFVVIALQGKMLEAVRTRRPGAHLLRALVGFVGMSFGFAALTFLPLSDATAISYVVPLMIVVLSAVMLHENVRIYRWSAVGVGFIGVLIMLYPQLGGGEDRSMLGVGLALVSALGAALAQVQVRQMTATETTSSIVLYFTIFCAVFSLATIPFGWVMPQGVDWALLIAIGVLGGAGQLLLTQSYRFAQASVIAPLDYTSMIWASLFGYMIFGDLPDGFVVTGTFVVIAAGIFVIYRERRLGIDRTRARKAGYRIVN